MTLNPDIPTDLSRYARQMRYPHLGEAGQRSLAASRALVCGCGALGSLLANTLVRSGVGKVRLVDRDFVELSNLHRQTLFDEADVAAGLPKAVAAAEKLRKMNSLVEIEPRVVHIGPENVESLCEGVDVIVDGTDNFETRYLLNDAAVYWNLPWVFGGCVGAEGQTMTILPGETGCLRCLMPECPPPGSTPTCDTAGVLAPIVGLIASIQAQEAIKILSGHRAAISRQLLVIDLWQNRFLQLDVRDLRDRADCPACKQRQFAWLTGQQGTWAAVLCGRNAVQLTQPGPAIPLDALARRLDGLGHVVRNPFLLRLKVEGFELTLFPDGRTIIHGTDDPSVARTVYAKYIGS